MDHKLGNSPTVNADSRSRSKGAMLHHATTTFHDMHPSHFFRVLHFVEPSEPAKVRAGTCLVMEVHLEIAKESPPSNSLHLTGRGWETRGLSDAKRSQPGFGTDAVMAIYISSFTAGFTWIVASFVILVPAKPTGSLTGPSMTFVR